MSGFLLHGLPLVGLPNIYIYIYIYISKDGPWALGKMGLGADGPWALK